MLDDAALVYAFLFLGGWLVLTLGTYIMERNNGLV